MPRKDKIRTPMDDGRTMYFWGEVIKKGGKINTMIGVSAHYVFRPFPQQVYIQKRQQRQDRSRKLWQQKTDIKTRITAASRYSVKYRFSIIGTSVKSATFKR